MLIPHNTLIAVGDGGGIALFRNVGKDAELKLEPLPKPDIDPHSKDAGKRHHKSVRERNQTLIEEDSLAAAITDWLNHRALENGFQHIVIAAPAKFLGEMRRHYHKVLEGRLLGELAKDLRSLQIPEIEKELRQVKAAK